MVSKFKFPLTFNTGVEHPSGSGSGLRLSAERIRRAFVLGGRGNSSNAAAGEADRAPIMSQQQDIVSSEDYGETTDDELIGKESSMIIPVYFPKARISTARKDLLSKFKKKPVYKNWITPDLIEVVFM